MARKEKTTEAEATNHSGVTPARDAIYNINRKHAQYERLNEEAEARKAARSE